MEKKKIRIKWKINHRAGVLGVYLLILPVEENNAQLEIINGSCLKQKAIQALKESVRIMRGKKGKLFYLQLSFIGIYLLGAIACGIGLLWVIPYMQVTMANFYRKITGEI